MGRVFEVREPFELAPGETWRFNWATLRRAAGVPTWHDLIKAVDGPSSQGEISEVVLDGAKDANPGAVKHHGLYLGGEHRPAMVTYKRQSWVLNNLEVKDCLNAGVFADSNIDLHVNGLKGSGCDYGEVVIFGHSVDARLEGLEGVYLNHEIDAAGGAGRCQVLDSTLRRLEIRCRNTGDRVDLKRVRLLEDAPMELYVNTGELSAVACDFSGARGASLVHPERMTWVGCISPRRRVWVRGQTRWGGDIDDSLLMRGGRLQGELDVDGHFTLRLEGVEMADGLEVRAHRMSAVEPRVDIWRDGGQVASLTRGGIWRPGDDDDDD